MQTKTAAGLIGANAYLQETRVPMKVFKEARAEGDTAKMERAMGYVEKLSTTAQGYKKQADKGLREDAEQAREEAQKQREELAQRIRENRAETEERLEQTERTDSALPEAAENGADAESATAENAHHNAKVTSDSTALQEFTAHVTYTRDGRINAQPAEVEFFAVG